MITREGFSKDPSILPEGLITSFSPAHLKGARSKELKGFEGFRYCEKLWD